MTEQVAASRVVPIRFVDGVLELLDQRELPAREIYVRCHSAEDAATAIRDMVVRGAPALSIAAAYGLALAAARGDDLDAARQVLLDSRPTAVNLKWALDQLANVPRDALRDAAAALHKEDLRINRALGDHGAAAISGDVVHVYHHCNTGALATGGWGTALGVIRSLHAQGRTVHVYVGETRPYLQGARLTAWECQQEGIPCTLVVDSAAATVLPRCDAVLMGCDRVAANGDTANKIGTHMLAVLAKRFEVPFYVCMPESTLDRGCADGSQIPIEERSRDEVLGHRGVVWAADVPVFNPAFDVTPAELVTAWVTEHGLWYPPFPATV